MCKSVKRREGRREKTHLGICKILILIGKSGRETNNYSIGATSKLGSNSDKQPVGWTVPESERLLETGALLKNLLPAETGKIKLVIIFWGQL